MYFDADILDNQQGVDLTNTGIYNSQILLRVKLWTG